MYSKQVNVNSNLVINKTVCDFNISSYGLSQHSNSNTNKYIGLQGVTLIVVATDCHDIIIQTSISGTATGVTLLLVGTDCHDTVIQTSISENIGRLQG